MRSSRTRSDCRKILREAFPIANGTFLPLLSSAWEIEPSALRSSQNGLIRDGSPLTSTTRLLRDPTCVALPSLPETIR